MKKLVVTLVASIASIMPTLAFAQPPTPSCVLQGGPGVSQDTLQQVIATAQANLKANQARIEANFQAGSKAVPGGDDNAHALNTLVAQFNQDMAQTPVAYKAELANRCAVVGCQVMCQ
jgi:hypothetical protein